MGRNSVATNRGKERAQDVLERVTVAIEMLCVGKGDVRSRLEYAVGHLIPLREKDFPDGLGCSFRKIIQQSTKYDASDLYKRGYIRLEALSPDHPQFEGRLHSTMRRIRRSTGSKIARDIWNLYSELKRMAA